MEHYLSGWKRFAEFSGRTGRMNFWIFTLINYAILMLLSQFAKGSEGFTMVIIVGIWELLILIPSIAICVRRLNDIGKEWWYMLIPFYNLYLFAQPSEAGPNAHGAEPA